MFAIITIVIVLEAAVLYDEFDLGKLFKQHFRLVF